MKDLKNYLAKYQVSAVVKTVRQLTKWAGFCKEEIIKELDRLQTENELSYFLMDRLPGGPFVFLTSAEGFDQAELLLPAVYPHTSEKPWAAQVFNLLAEFEDAFTDTQDHVNRYNLLIPTYFEYYKNSVLYDPTMVADLSGQTEDQMVDLSEKVSQAIEDQLTANLQYCYLCQQEATLDRRLCADCTEKISAFVRYPVAWLINSGLISNAVYVELIRQYQTR